MLILRGHIASVISIHALREEGDLGTVAVTTGDDLFLSTPSARRATPEVQDFPLNWFISIHALREEGDRSEAGLSMSDVYFYPRPPRGGRP